MTGLPPGLRGKGQEEEEGAMGPALGPGRCMRVFPSHNGRTRSNSKMENGAKGATTAAAGLCPG